MFNSADALTVNVPTSNSAQTASATNPGWGQSLNNFLVVPPSVASSTRVNLEYLQRIALSPTEATRGKYSKFTWWTMPTDAHDQKVVEGLLAPGRIRKRSRLRRYSKSTLTSMRRRY